MMAADPLDDYIDAVMKPWPAGRGGLEAAVKANLEVSLRWRLVDEFALSDETEPASVFAA